MNKNSLTFRFMFFTIIIITIVMGINLIWDYNEQKKQGLNQMKENARIITNQLNATWDFMSINQDKINYDSEGNFEFKHLNCSTVGMGIAAFFNMSTDYSIKQTNISPRNALNTPDEFELNGLLQFSEDPNLKEYWDTYTIEEETVFRYISPLEIEKSCLECHGEPKGKIDISGFPMEGWKLGDLGGAISITIPMDLYYQNLKTNFLIDTIIFVFLIIMCVISIYFLVTKLVTSSLGQLEKAVSQVGKGNLEFEFTDIKAKGEIKQLADYFQHMVVQLRDLYGNLELKVEERTEELEKANNILKNKQQELENANIQLQEANKYKSEFLAIMSHELRTPLTSIIAFTEMLLMDNYSEEELEKHYLKEILINSQILLRLINNILDMAKIDAGRNEVVLETMDMADVIVSVEGVIMPLAVNKDIQLDVSISPKVPLIKADSEKIRSLVENLASNAVKFTEKGGKIEIGIDFDKVRKEVLIIVKDTGIGISQEDQKNIFEKFTQSDTSISRKYSGSGIGLALAKELVELHGGWIKVDSTLGEGSCFSVGIPAKVVE